MGVGQLHRPPQRARDDRLGVLAIDHPAAAEGIHHHLVAVHGGRDDEVRRQPDALDRQTHPPRDLDRDHRERDRDSQPPCQHVVEKAVSRIVIFLAVAAKPFLLEEEHPESVERPPSPEGTRAGARGEVVEPAEPGLGLEVGILDAGDRQGGPTQVDLPVGPPKELAELVEWVSSQGRGGFRPS